MTAVSPLNKTISNLNDGTIERLNNGEIIFKLHSHPENPIIKPTQLQQTWIEAGKLRSGAIFNGGATLFNNKIIHVPRAQKEYQRGRFFDESLNVYKSDFKNYISKIWILISDNGINFHRYYDGVIRGDGSTHKDFLYGLEDVRIIKLNDRYWLIGCGKVVPAFQGLQGVSGDRIAIYSTTDFQTITYHGIVNDIEVRNVVIFPEAIAGDYFILTRFDKQIQIAKLDAELLQLEDPVKYIHLWKEIYKRRKKNVLLETGDYYHEQEKIGPGPPPIKTYKGWLLIYHSVGKIEKLIAQNYNLPRSIPRGYSICAALLDLHNPSQVLCDTKYPIYIPSQPYELYGNLEFPIDVPAVTFPVGAIVINDKLMLYCGAGDKYIILLSTNLSSLINYLWNECKVDTKVINMR